jgi:hypothetical protein
MATNKVFDTYIAAAAFTITKASLASSVAGVGRQTALLTANTHRRAKITFLIKLGTNPTANKSVQFYLIRSDGTRYDDAGGASDAAITVKNAQCVFVAQNTSATTGEIVEGSFIVENMGPIWGIAIVHDTAVNLDATEENHYLGYEYVDDDIQAAA